MAKEISYEFIRGDTQVLRKFRPTDENKEPIVLTDLDQIYFTMKNANQEAVVKKKIGNGVNLEEDGYYHITLNATDTQDLPAGNYMYDIELDLALVNLFVSTLIEGEISLLEGVTQKGDR